MMKAFREVFSKAKNVVVLSGAGISAESGVPSEFWYSQDVQKLATPESFRVNPSPVWELYNYQRGLVYPKEPNEAHKAVADLEHRLHLQGRKVTVITQNTDHLHVKAGSKNVLELNGSLFKTRCTKCGHVQENYNVFEPADKKRYISCEECGGALRPHVVWTGESHDLSVLYAIDDALRQCDLFLQVGTSSIVYPAAAYGRILASRGIPCAEFNLTTTPVTELLRYFFRGNCAETLPVALAKHPSEL